MGLRSSKQTMTSSGQRKFKPLLLASTKRVDSI